VKTARNYLLQGPSYTALNSPLAVMQNFQILGAWLPWQQAAAGGKFK